MTGIERSSHGEAYDAAKFEAAVQIALQMEKRDYPAYIGGMKVASGVDFPVKSPIDDSIMFGLFQEPEKGITDFAVESSLKTYGSWKSVDVLQKVSYFEKVLELICAQRYRLAATVSLSCGMTGPESLSEVDALMDVISSECLKAKESKRRSKGAWAVISAHNSPLASPMGFAVAAMLAGNTVIVMPSRFCPVPVYCVYDLLEKAGLPGGVINLVVDRKDKTAEELANDARLAGVVVSGSGNYIEDMMFLQVDDELSFINEIKGMNPAIVYRPGDMKKVAKEIIESAFRYSGQHLYSCSKVIVTADDQQKFMDAMLDQVKSLVVGDPTYPDTFSGPLISEACFKTFEKTVKSNYDFLIFGGSRVLGENTQNGFYVMPAMFTGQDEENELSYMDSGLPMLCVKVVGTVDDAFEELAYTECGLSAGIFTKDGRVIERFKEEADVPQLYINESSSSLRPALSAKIENFSK